MQRKEPNVSDAIDKPDFTLDWHSELPSEDMNDVLYDEAEQSLRKLQKGHTDLIGGMVSIKEPSHKESPPAYVVTVTAYVRPENMAATEKSSDSPRGALKQALRAVERQVRDKRERLRNH